MSGFKTTDKPFSMDSTGLVFQRDDKVLLHLRLDRAEVCIGSNPTNDVVVPDRSVADVSALLIDLGAQRYRLRDLTAGQLKVNGRALSEEAIDLVHGDVIQIGDYTLTLERREADEGRHRFGRTEVLGQKPPQARVAQIRYQGASHQVLAEQHFNIGGHADNELVITDPFVSSFHCRISNQDGRWFLTDLESTNGTEVNGLRVDKAELPIPASIKVGEAIVTFDVPGPSEEAGDDTPVWFHGMLGQSPAMRRVFNMIERVSDAGEPVLITGESGCGKELVARSIHDASRRADKPFLALNCGALSASLIEPELFGHVKGAFTGAGANKPGAFEATHEGTLFLDEIGELPLDLQPKLLRVLESSTVRRVGDTKEVPVDCRIVAATNRNLEQRVQENRFREDLFHRLFVLSVRIPPLAERTQDILPLARYFLGNAPEPRSLDRSAEDALMDYTWPGNIRELRNVLVRAVCMSDRDVLAADDLELLQDAFTIRSKDARQSVRRYDEVERQNLINALDEARATVPRRPVSSASREAPSTTASADTA